MPDDKLDKGFNRRRQKTDAEYAQWGVNGRNRRRNIHLRDLREHRNSVRSRLEQLRDRAASKAFAREPRENEKLIYEDGYLYYHDPWAGTIYVAEGPDGHNVGTTVDLRADERSMKKVRNRLGDTRHIDDGEVSEAEAARQAASAAEAARRKAEGAVRAKANRREVEPEETHEDTDSLRRAGRPKFGEPKY